MLRACDISYTPSAAIDPLFSDFSLEVAENEVVTLSGASGVGKTTLARLLVGELEPDAGEIYFRERTVSSLFRERTVRRRLQWIPQEAGASLTPRRIIESQMAEALKFHGIASSQSQALERICRKMPLFGLSRDLLKRIPSELSGGEQQRFAWLRAFLLEPDLIILDEPTSQLDPVTTLELLELFEAMRRQRPMSCLWISHDQRVLKRVGGRSLELKRDCGSPVLPVLIDRAGVIGRNLRQDVSLGEPQLE